MIRRPLVRTLTALLPLLLLGAAPAGKPGSIQGSFVLNGVKAKLNHIRAQWMKLDEKGTKGVAIRLSERPVEGDIEALRAAEPSRTGDYFHIIFEPTGDIWVYDTGHTAAKTGHFGGVLEVKKIAYEVKDGRVKAHVQTPREQDFGEDRFTVDLTFEAPIEGS